MDIKKQLSTIFQRSNKVQQFYNFDKIWELLKKYDKFFGTLSFESPEIPWKLFRILSVLNFILFYLVTVYCAIVYKDDVSEFLVFVSFSFLLTFCLVYKVFLIVYKNQLIKLLKWCETRHELSLQGSKEIFNSTLQMAVKLLKTRIEFSILFLCLTFIVGGTYNILSTGNYTPFLPMYIPIFENDNLATFVCYSAHQLLGLIYDVLDGYTVGGISVTINRYILGQLELGVELIKKLGNNIEDGMLNPQLLSVIVDLHNETTE